MPHALTGVRVLDLTQVMAGPFCAMQLCDMGADVIKVEPTGGDPTRSWGERGQLDTPAFNAVNRGKRSMVVDLKHTEGRALVQQLASGVDVLIENYRPGVMTGFGLDYPTLHVQHPGLIYASISGYGQTGPSSRKGGFDLVAQGVSGIMSVTGEPDGAPTKTGIPVTDLGAGLFALSGILAALYRRTQTGEGQLIDTSLVEAGVALSVWEAAEFFSTGVSPRPFGSAHRTSAPYQAIRCADGYLTIGAANDRLFERLCALLEHPEWVSETKFATNAMRVRHHDELAEQIEAITSRQSGAVWLQRFEDAGIPCGPINTYAEVFADEQMIAREMMVETEHPALGSIRTLGTPIKLSETPLDPRRPAPTLGQHTDEVLADAGLSPEAIAALRASGAVA